LATKGALINEGFIKILKITQIILNQSSDREIAGQARNDGVRGGTDFRTFFSQNAKKCDTTKKITFFLIIFRDLGMIFHYFWGIVNQIFYAIFAK
jgi:hypothetical protein